MYAVLHSSVSEVMNIMAFIKCQKLVYDESGALKSGPASIVDTVYGQFGIYHARYTVREKLGRGFYLGVDKQVSIFLSPTRKAC